MIYIVMNVDILCINIYSAYIDGTMKLTGHTHRFFTTSTRHKSMTQSTLPEAQHSGDQRVGPRFPQEPPVA